MIADDLLEGNLRQLKKFLGLLNRDSMHRAELTKAIKATEAYLAEFVPPEPPVKKTVEQLLSERADEIRKKKAARDRSSNPGVGGFWAVDVSDRI